MTFARGAFMREGGQFAGVFASPDGPVFFLNEEHLPLRYGYASAITVKQQDAPMMHFTLTAMDESGHAHRFSMVYRERHGIGTNPYDNDLEDVDLLALIARNLRQEFFFSRYRTGH
jgi:hypothetical protein